MKKPSVTPGLYTGEAKSMVLGMRDRMVLCFLLAGCASAAHGQIPVEVFAGHEKTTIDIQFFRYVKKQSAQQSRWLFFNRNRASVDYRMTSTEYRPQFGFTEAISYNPPALKGFAPVAVVQVFASGVYPKAGIQYAKTVDDWMIFSWLVTEVLRKPDLDYFLLVRYTPKLNSRLRLFLQAESINSLPLHGEGASFFVQRLRAGLKQQYSQWGIGADLSQDSHTVSSFASNLGLFLRYEF
jgi:hypothetical protein